MQDLFESQTVDDCSVLFGIVESHADELEQSISGTQRA